MKILSIDVGIYNLAICLLDVDTSAKIVFWKDINILNGKQTCSSKGCKCVATHVKDDKCYCIKCKTSLFPNQRLQTIKTAMNTRIEKIAEMLYTSLDTDLQNLEYDTVLIENQPTRNIKMKNISMLLLGYFTMKQKSIEFVNASKKMQETSITLPNNYVNRKKSSKITVKSLLKDSDWSLFFKCSKKQDDLSDCLLQGLWWIHKNISNDITLDVSATE